MLICDTCNDDDFPLQLHFPLVEVKKYQLAKVTTNTIRIRKRKVF
jgi:hypothetical protein